ncbi:macrophage erythroblast attacher-like protein [Dinothrombium tinctorium]|uniref:E3 ubiquitin-protein transferase MAEA n=1 Tax=Dinothrombium tinctorium TaxID=1965070 RepID=A0A443RQA9_9ACAR|nr:macrophage erythroblast attacher-like protein [Dinothrombium tinctorium]RWS17491.1 macrophage erythroblast attacher-like protein [Dinothrombium tinctorium]
MSDVKCLEHQTLKVPYEILNKKFRGAQKCIDREVSYVQNAVADLEKTVLGNDVQNPPTVGTITELLSGVVEKLAALKRKAKESFTDEIEAAGCCKRRLDHLKEYCVKTNETAVNHWTKKRLDRMLVEHFLLCGYYDTAIKLALHSNVENLTNIDLFLVSRQVEESLSRKETACCLNWCHDNKSKLRKMKSSLEFNIRQQEFIELLRNNQRLEAVRHARKYFSNLDDKSEEQQKDLQHVMGLLAFQPDTEIEPYKSLFDESRWKSLINQFRQENFKLFQLSSISVFSVTLQSGLSALKTPQCYKKDGERNPDCPVCSDLLNQLAKPLPCSHCSQSRLVCSISGQPLNEHNQPLVLPNGNVYGENALKQMALKNNGKIICPRTKQVFDMKEVEKVFVM